MDIEIRVLGQSDEHVLRSVAPGVFDNQPEPNLTREFLSDPRHHIAVAIDGGTVVGFASALHYVHPDKPAELWINEIGVAPAHRKRGLGWAVLNALFEIGRARGCKTAWVLTERTNSAALALYASAGGKPMSEKTIGFEFLLDASNSK